MRVSVSEALEIHGYESVVEALEEAVCDGDCIACCSDGCTVEPDGHCEHGHPSIMIVLGMC